MKNKIEAGTLEDFLKKVAQHDDAFTKCLALC